ncbi:hypothetical protein PFISCL1PPCAC_23349 [Pristionchus fissidentatus]|uniref:Uncharacterized protein n=1 Tax=Pristionchus fissidentatus TaxID=1538716 RepID=A0AAV5WQF8_9BILA|nr:hypothetical protein PFISCL1PPCAC_23349 [Pristionchus fissidentatus]
MISSEQIPNLCPTTEFVSHLCAKYAHLIWNGSDNAYDPVTGQKLSAVPPMFEASVRTYENVEEPAGEAAMAELHEHIGNAQTYCALCGFNTGGRDEFYTHIVSYFHIIKISQGSARFDLLTLLVNVHRQEYWKIFL